MTFRASHFRPWRGWTTAAAALAAALLALLLAAGAAAFETPASMRLFGYGERATLGIAEFPKWTHMLGRYEQEKLLEAQPCTDGACRLQRWRSHLKTLAGRDKLAQLRGVNAYVNAIAFRTDQSNYGLVDYWATPREFFARGGDCEDFSIVKYLSLRHLGWDMDYVRVAVTMHERRRELHAVLAVKAEGTTWILDNLLPEPTDHRQLGYYRPIFSINETAWWRHSQPGIAESGDTFVDDDELVLARGGCETASDFLAAIQGGRDPEWPRYTRMAR